MGSKSSSQSQTQNQSQTSHTQFDPRSGSEQQILNQLQGYGNNQLSFLNQLMQGGTSPFSLQPADQAQLDQSYGGAINRFNQEGRDMADYLATTRGLNKSDTPVGQQVMDRYGMGMADLLSQKANAGLNMGLSATGLRLQGSQALPSGLLGAFNPQFQERMASGTQYTNGTGSSSSSMQYNPSLMDNISQGIGIGSQALGLGAQMFGPLKGLSMGGGGGLGSMMGGSGMGAAAGPAAGSSYKLGVMPGLL